jgi:predicted transcriptional regulator
METAARELTAAGYSRRDAATLLGISHQRVQQLLDGGSTDPSG